MPNQFDKKRNYGIIKWYEEEKIMMKSDNANQLLNWTFMRKATAQDVVRRIQYGDDPNGCDWEKSTPLHKAIQAYNFEAFRTLMEHGADPFVRDASGREIGIPSRLFAPAHFA